MNKGLFRRVVLLVALGLGAACAAVQAAPAAQEVEQVLKKQFDQPSNPLKVAPVVVEGPWAVAGWTQGERGGRAVLRQTGGRWSIEFCSGDGVKEAKALAQLGVEAKAAQRLATRLREAEAKLPAEQVRKFSLFDGTIRIQGEHPPHDAAHGTADHAGHKPH
jgi:periplasmic copper chaperone A